MRINGKLAPFYAPGEVPEDSCLKCARFRFKYHCEFYKDGDCKHDNSGATKFVQYPDWLKRLADMNAKPDSKKWLFTEEEANAVMEGLYDR